MNGIKLKSSHCGAVAVELALVLPILLILVSGVIEYGRALWYYDALAKGARDASRYLSTIPVANLGAEALTGSTTRTIVAETASQAGVIGFDPDTDIAVTCAPTSCGAALTEASVTTVTVAVSYPFVIGSWIPLFGPSPGDSPATFAITMVPHVTMRYMR